ncbi:hypothetical protein Taro_010681 [Colocasia esculenta]|uniref:ATP-dependent RNA helicase DHX29-like UBA domain-containing protein n=1 Tax=Colocasia esculenta TaxID=4460 RepID=A0A843U3Q5_COLES|nr:hypothetical protein [Colocasia esculenta]
MAPKKKPPQQKQKHAGKAGNPQRSGSKAAPKLQISAENERRLRRLLMNTERPAPAAAPDANESISREQKARKLRSIYDKLSLEGFTSKQIERALSALAEGATFESALDWLCFNLPGDELPLKFSSSGSMTTVREERERSIKVISRAQDDWVPNHPSNEISEQKSGLSIRIKGKQEESLMDLGEPSQADWIKQYVKQQEEEEQEEEEEKEKQPEKESDDNLRGSSIIKEYHLARLAALEAKRKGDKKSQEHLSSIIRKLKQEMTSLGLSDEVKPGELYQFDSAAVSIDNTQISAACKHFDSEPQCDEHSLPHDSTFESSIVACENVGDPCSFRERECAVDSSVILDTVDLGSEKEEPDIPELDDLFCEDAASAVLPAEIVKLQKKDKGLQFAHGETLKNFDALWRKGDPARIPKSVLQKVCQQLGWEAPKYNKLSERESKCLYSVSILRTTTGRGKSRKVGGLITLQLSDQDQSLGSVEDAQNKVAAFALYQLFPDLPVHELLIEPYSSCVRKWREGMRHVKDAESTLLKQELEKRKKMPNYMGYWSTCPASTWCLPALPFWVARRSVTLPVSRDSLSLIVCATCSPLSEHPHPVAVYCPSLPCHLECHPAAPPSTNLATAAEGRLG